MEDILKLILSIDSLEREAATRAEDVMGGRDPDIQKRIREIKNDYYERAVKRLEILEESERSTAAGSLAQQTAKNGELIAVLEQTYSQNAERWVSEIFERVLM